MSAIEQFQGQSLMAQAEMLSKSGIVPKAFRGKPADVLAACLWGAEIGLGPMASMGYIDVIDGNPTLNTEGRMALVRRAGHSVQIKADDKQATVVGKRKDSGDTQTVTFTMDMAKRAGLASKQVWKSYPEAMLTSRALSQLCRNLFPDVMMGMSYAPEEAASFAAPAMLDAQPDELAARTNGQARSPIANLERAPSDPAAAELMAGAVIRSGPPPVAIDPVTAEILTVPEAAKAQAKTNARNTRSFPPPSQSAQNTKAIMQDFKDADAAKAYDALKARKSALSAAAAAQFKADLDGVGLLGFNASSSPDEFEQVEALLASAEALDAVKS